MTVCQTLLPSSCAVFGPFRLGLAASHRPQGSSATSATHVVPFASPASICSLPDQCRLHRDPGCTTEVRPRLP
jgi:hypothetical protein